MQEMEKETARWNEVAQNLTEIEAYQSRNINVWSRHFRLLQRRQHLPVLDSYNLFLSKTDAARRLNYLPERLKELEQGVKALQLGIQDMPKLETTVYRSVIMRKNDIRALDVGHIYYADGFTHGTARLDTAMRRLDASLLEAENNRVLFKIKNKRGRLMTQFFTESEAEFIWRPKVHFRITKKDFSPATRHVYDGVRRSSL